MGLMLRGAAAWLGYTWTPRRGPDSMTIDRCRCFSVSHRRLGISKPLPRRSNEQHVELGDHRLA
jgi:hypothetical protein